jgi:ADP-heptose:LPS heptosyltransferase
VTNVRHVLVYRCGTLGDTLVAVPAIQALRAAFPGARFTLMTAHDPGGKLWADEVVREFGWFDATLVYESAELWSPLGLARVLRRVRRARPDLVAYLASDRNSPLRLWRDRAFFALAGTRAFLAPTPSPKSLPWGRLRRPRATLPFEVERLLAACTRRGMGDGTVRFELPDGAGQAARVAALVEAAGVDGARPLVALCPGSKQAIKRWPVERWTALGARLVAETDAAIAIVGGPEEAEIGNAMARQLPAGRVVVLAARTSVLESAALLRRCALYVGNDTGAMHLAAAVGTPCVAVFAAREPARSWHPYGDGHVVLRRDDVSCAPCYRSRCTTEGLRCLLGIEVEQVWGACRTVLARATRPEERRRCAG